MTPLLAIEDFHVAYGKVEAVRGVNLALAPGQIVTVIGPNGAGKTTLLAAAAGPAARRAAKSSMMASISGAWTSRSASSAAFCLVPERRELFGDMAVVDNLLLGAYSRRDGDDAASSLRRGLRTLSAARRAPPQRPARCPAASGRCWRSAAR